MKKIFILTMVALVSSLTASAQFYPDGRPIHPSKRGAYYQQHPRHSRHSYTDTYSGIRFGVGIATVNSDSPYLDGNKARTGFYGGLAVGVGLSAQTPIYLESGIYYSQKGGKSETGGEKFSYNLDYLEFPVVFKYKAYVGDKLSVEPFVGGFFSCGVAGKIKDYQYREAYSSFSNKYDDNFERFDAGIRVGCGFSVDMFYVEAAYDFGLANVGKYSFDDTHTGAANISVGLNF